MNQCIRFFLLGFVFSHLWSDSYGEIDWYVKRKKIGTDILKGFSGLGHAFVGLGRSMKYGWHLSGNSINDTDYAFHAAEAEYFFYKEQRVRDRRYRRCKENLQRKQALLDGAKSVEISCNWIGMIRDHKKKKDLEEDRDVAKQKFVEADRIRRYEFYCREQSLATLRKYCKWALLNEELEKLHWEMDYTEEPKCEYRRVYLQHLRYKTKRTFLRCGYSIKKDEHPEEKIFRYISAVKHPRQYRLILYLFESLEIKAKPDESHESSKYYVTEETTKNASVDGFPGASKFSYPNIDPQPPQKNPYVNSTQAPYLPQNADQSKFNHVYPPYLPQYTGVPQSYLSGNNPYIQSDQGARNSNFPTVSQGPQNVQTPKPEDMKGPLKIVSLLFNRRFTLDSGEAIQNIP